MAPCTRSEVLPSTTGAEVSVEEDDVIAFCAERLPGYKCPNKVWFVDEIPRGITGKVLRSRYGMDVGTPIYSNVVDFDMDFSAARR